MMDWNDGGWGWGAWLAMAVVMVAFWGVVAWAIITLVRGWARSPRGEPSAEDILAARFARGEIDESEYKARRDAAEITKLSQRRTRRDAHMADTAGSTARLTEFYGDLSPSLEAVVAILTASGVDIDHLKASDLYESDLDCHNLGMHAMLDVLAGVVADYGAPDADNRVLDLGCGIGGPGRFVVDRFGCSVVGVDLLALRVELAQALTNMTGMAGRISYRVADATNLGIEAESFEQVWMLDVSMHIKDKRALFGEIARVLRPGGLMVMHEMPGPLPKAMSPLTRRVPYIAPSLPQLIRYVEGSGLRLLTWRDTTQNVLDYFKGVRALLGDAPASGSEGSDGAARDVGIVALNAYIETLGTLGGRTGILIARRVA